jgi:hypothetical protein
MLALYNSLRTIFGCADALAATKTRMLTGKIGIILMDYQIARTTLQRH